MCFPWLSALGSGVYGRLVYLRPGSTVNTQHLVDSKRRFAFVADGQSWAEAIGLSATDPCLHVRLGSFPCNPSWFSPRNGNIYKFRRRVVAKTLAWLCWGSGDSGPCPLNHHTFKEILLRNGVQQSWIDEEAKIGTRPLDFDRVQIKCKWICSMNTKLSFVWDYESDNCESSSGTVWGHVCAAHAL